MSYSNYIVTKPAGYETYELTQADVVLLEGPAIQIFLVKEGDDYVKVMRQNLRKNSPMLVRIGKRDAEVVNDPLFHDYMQTWIIDSDASKFEARKVELLRVAAVIGREVGVVCSYDDIKAFAINVLRDVGVYEDQIEMAEVKSEKPLALLSMDSQPVVGCNVNVGTDNTAQDVAKAINMLSEEMAGLCYRAAYNQDLDVTDPYDFGFCYLLFLNSAARRKFVARVIVNNEAFPRVMSREQYHNYRNTWPEQDFGNYVQFTIRSTGIHIRPYFFDVFSEYHKIETQTLFNALDMYYDLRARGLGVAWHTDRLQFTGVTDGVGLRMVLPLMKRRIRLDFDDDGQHVHALKNQDIDKSGLFMFQEFVNVCHTHLIARGVVLPAAVNKKLEVMRRYRPLAEYLDSGGECIFQDRQAFAVGVKKFVHIYCSHVTLQSVINEVRKDRRFDFMFANEQM